MCLALMLEISLRVFLQNHHHPGRSIPQNLAKTWLSYYIKAHPTGLFGIEEVYLCKHLVGLFVLIYQVESPSLETSSIFNGCSMQSIWDNWGFLDGFTKRPLIKFSSYVSLVLIRSLQSLTSYSTPFTVPLPSQKSKPVIFLISFPTCLISTPNKD